MTYRGHLVVGGGSTVAALWYLLPAEVGWPCRATLACVALFGALLPDADCPQSWLGKRLLGLPYLVKFALSNPLTWLLAGHADRGVTRWRRRWQRTRGGVDVRPTAGALARAAAGAASAGGWLLGTLGLAWYLPWRYLANGRQRLSIVVRHRGYSHSLLSLLLLTGLGTVAFVALYHAGALYLPEWAYRHFLAAATLRPFAWVGWHAGALALGIASHLVLDGCTIEGVPLWLPVSRDRIHLLPAALRFRSV